MQTISWRHKNKTVKENTKGQRKVRERERERERGGGGRDLQTEI